jgi:hypothetical protein
MKYALPNADFIMTKGKYSRIKIMAVEQALIFKDLYVKSIWICNN